MAVLLERVTGFLVASAWDVAWELLVPGCFSLPLKLAENFYHCFLTDDPKAQRDILKAAEQWSDEEIAELAALIASQWQQRTGKETPETIRADLREMLVALREAGRDPKPDSPAESLRMSLNRRLAPVGHTLRPKLLSAEQRQIGRLRTRCLLAAIRGASSGWEPVPPDAPAVPGYELLRQLGVGGFASVYLARHLATGKPRAVKVGPLTDARRFMREAQILKRLKHPHLVRYFEHGEVSGQFWIAMEYLGTDTLARLLAVPRTRVATGAALLLGEQILRGLSALHSRQIIHRDLKPANMMVDRKYRLKLIDMGLAKPLAATPDASTGLTAAGDLYGTPQYMSPEQVNGEPLSCASDIWSFGTVLYELLTGVSPFQGATHLAVGVEIMTRVVDLDIPAIPEELRGFLGRCLTHKPGGRHPDATVALAEFVSLASQIRRRLRHERRRLSWLPVLDKRLLEQFIADCGGELPEQAVRRFCQYAEVNGVRGLDEARLGKILPLIAEKQRAAEEAANAVVQARWALQQAAAQLSPRQIKRHAEEVERRERSRAAAVQAVTPFIRDLLADEVRPWEGPEQTRERRAPDVELLPEEEEAGGEATQWQTMLWVGALVSAGIGLVVVVAILISSARPPVADVEEPARVGVGITEDFSALKSAALEGTPDIRVAALKAIAQPDAPDRAAVLRLLLDATEDSNETVRKTALDGLAAVRLDGKGDWGVLKGAVAHKNPEARVLVLRAIALPDVPERPVALRAFLDAWGQDQEPVREAARAGVAALRLDGRQDFDTLQESVAHKDPGVRILVFRALAAGASADHHESVRDTLTKGLSDQEQKVRLVAFDVLATFPWDPKTDLPALTDLVHPKNEADVRALAVRAMGALTKPAPSAERGALLRPVLLSVLRGDKEPAIRAEALAALNRLGRPPESETADLVRLLRGEPLEVRIYAASALGKLGPAGSEAVPALADALGDGSDEVQRLAAEALLQIGARAAAAAPRLAEVSGSSGNDQLRRLALEALVRIGRNDASVKALREALKGSNDASIRGSAVDGLVKFGEADDLAVLARVLPNEKEPALRLHIAECLADAFAGTRLKRATEVVADLGRALRQEEESDVRRELVRALGAIGPDATSAIPAIVQALGKLEPEKAGWEEAHQKSVRSGMLVETAYNAAEQKESAKLGVFVKGLAAMGPEGVKKTAVPELKRLLYLADPKEVQDAKKQFVRWAAAYTLGRLGPDAYEAHERLHDLRRNEPDRFVREAARRAYNQVKKE